MLLGIRPLYVQNLRTAQQMEPVLLNDIREVSHWTFFFRPEQSLLAQLV